MEESQEAERLRRVRELMERIRKLMQRADYYRDEPRPENHSDFYTATEWAFIQRERVAKWTGGNDRYTSKKAGAMEGALKRQGLCRIHRGIFPCTTIPNNEVIYETTVKP